MLRIEKRINIKNKSYSRYLDISIDVPNLPDKEGYDNITAAINSLVEEVYKLIPNDKPSEEKADPSNA